MGLLTSLLTAPIKAPVSGTLWVARKVTETANGELNDPATLRRSLAQLEMQLLACEISEKEYDAAETALLMKLRANQ